MAAHWIADRQSGPNLLRYGTEAQRREILPRIAAGECFFVIGMSEPDSGSDLASIRTKATRGLPDDPGPRRLGRDEAGHPSWVAPGHRAAAAQRRTSSTRRAGGTSVR